MRGACQPRARGQHKVRIARGDLRKISKGHPIDTRAGEPAHGLVQPFGQFGERFEIALQQCGPLLVKQARHDPYRIAIARNCAAPLS